MQIIALDNVSKQYSLKRSIGDIIRNHPAKKIDAVTNLSFSIDEGEIVGYLGVNGAGKSTTIKMLSGILIPSSGNLSVFGTNPYTHRMQNNYKIGAVFGQRSQLIWDLPPLDSFSLNSKIYNISKSEYKKRLTEYVDLLEVGNIINVPVRKLSLGQRMCCEIIASLLHNPKLLFLDEPTIGLDILNKERILSAVQHLNMQHNTTVFFTTHDIEDVEQICKRIIVIDNGSKIYDGSIDTLKSKFATQKSIYLTMTSSIPIGDLTDILKIASCVYEDGHLNISYDEKKISSIDMINLCVRSIRNIKQISTRENTLEDVLKRIYKGGITL